MKNNKIEKQREQSVLNFSQRHELIEAIERRNEIPHKFAYLNNGAETWDMITKASDYDLGKRELYTIRKFMQLVCEKLKNESFNILHIGSGNGIEIPTIMEILGVQQIAHYALVDISPELLKMAESYGNKHFESLRFLSFIHDITKPNISRIAETLRQNGASRNLILLIANGAILSNSSCLNYIRKSMTSEDRLLITLEVYIANREKQILEQYKLPSITTLFTRSLSLIGINDLTPDDLEFIYNKEKSMVEVYFLAKQWLELHAHENITFDVPLPEKIKIFSSFRPDSNKLKKFLLSKGFKIEFFHYFERESCCGVVCNV